MQTSGDTTKPLRAGFPAPMTLRLNAGLARDLARSSLYPLSISLPLGCVLVTLVELRPNASQSRGHVVIGGGRSFGDVQ